MKHQDDGPMTPEKAIKLKGHDIMMKLNRVGVPWTICNAAAIVVALELKSQFQKIYNSPDKAEKLKAFEKLEEGIKGYLPMSKEEILHCLVRDIERAYSEVLAERFPLEDSLEVFKNCVLEIVLNPKTKYKLFT